MKIGVVGASGYSGLTLLQLLARHPQVTVAVIASRSHAGKAVAEVLPSLRGAFPGLTFVNSNPAELAASDVDAFFLALPHGVAAEFALPLAEAGKQVIDLSADFRLNDPAIYRDYYGHEHPAPEWLPRVPYVIPELAPSGWQSARLIACPGCYPTSVQIPLVPLLRAGIVANERIVINSVSGVSGAGRKATEFYSYCERNESVAAYGAPKHRHLSEIEEQLSIAAGAPTVVQFTPHLVPMNRGIASTIVVPARADLDALYAAWNAAYAHAPFVGVLEPGRFPDTREVSHTNRVDISAVRDARTGNFVITSVLDNLIKGAGGQAIQILNLSRGFAETAGLL